MESPSFKDGKYSKDIPTRLSARYLEAREDPDLLKLHDEIALLDSRLQDVLKRVDTGDSSKLWDNLQKAWLEMMNAENPAKEAAARNNLGDMITKGQTDWHTWADVRKLLQERRALVESERKRLVETQQVITAEQAMTFLGAVVAAIRRYVTDKQTIIAITGEFERLTHRPELRANDDARVVGGS